MRRLSAFLLVTVILSGCAPTAGRYAVFYRPGADVWEREKKDHPIVNLATSAATDRAGENGVSVVAVVDIAAKPPAAVQWVWRRKNGGVRIEDKPPDLDWAKSLREHLAGLPK